MTFFQILRQAWKKFYVKEQENSFSRPFENEVNDYFELYKDQKDEVGRRVAKRNGHLPQRQIQTGLGAVTIEQPRIRGVSFTSAILPKYMRRVLVA
jgi:hypothetical protein